MQVIEDGANVRAQDGEKIAGYSLWQAKPRKAIKDPDGAGSAVAQTGLSEEQRMEPPELVSRTPLLKLPVPEGVTASSRRSSARRKNEGARVTLVPETEGARFARIRTAERSECSCWKAGGRWARHDMIVIGRDLA